MRRIGNYNNNITVYILRIVFTSHGIILLFLQIQDLIYRYIKGFVDSNVANELRLVIRQYFPAYYLFIYGFNNNL